MNMRKTTSLTMLISFVLLLVTSVILYIVPHGRVAYWSDWHMLGLSKTQWGDIHINLGVLFLLVGFIHLFYNWKPITAYMKNRAKELKVFTLDFNIALLLSLVITAGTLAEIPPMSTVINFGTSIKDTASKKYGEPPYGHAELSSLKMLTQKTDLDPAKAMQLLTDAGIHGVSEKISLADLAQANNTTPKALFALMQPARKNAGQDTKFPDTPPPGFGNKTLVEICSTYKLDLQAIIQGVQKNGITAEPERTLKEIAKSNDTDPHALFEIIHGLVELSQ